MMEANDFENLLEKYNNGLCNAEEKAVVESWFLNWKELEDAPTAQQIEQASKDVWNSLPGSRTNDNRNLHRIVIAAAIVLAIGIGFFYIKTETSHETRLAQDIAPGSNRATLSLSNGKVISLSNVKTGVIIDASKLTYTDGSAVSNTGSNAGMQMIATPKGGQYQVVLSDGTKVWLNAASTLKFPQSFAGSVNRRIEISGEVYLEVAKDKAHPFMVKSKMQEITVLGTHFNISAYEDEASTKSTLLEGSIKINDNILIKPGEQATNTGASIKVEQVDPNNSIAWKNGEFMFRKETLESIMRKIARWYDVEVIYMDKQQGTKLFGGTISRFTNVSEVLNMLQLTGQVHFKIAGRRIMVLK